jgi:hypothetical protein
VDGYTTASLLHSHTPLHTSLSPCVYHHKHTRHGGRDGPRAVRGWQRRRRSGLRSRQCRRGSRGAASGPPRSCHVTRPRTRPRAPSARSTAAPAPCAGGPAACTALTTHAHPAVWISLSCQYAGPHRHPPHCPPIAVCACSRLCVRPWGDAGRGVQVIMEGEGQCGGAAWARTRSGRRPGPARPSASSIADAAASPARPDRVHVRQHLTHAAALGDLGRPARRP